MRNPRESGEGSRSLAAGIGLFLLLASRSSGAEPGEPYLVKDINDTWTIEPQIEPQTGPSWLTVAGRLVFYIDDDGIHGQELWVSDGTPEGTSMVKDIRPGPGGSWPEELTAVGDRLFFAADDGAHGRELWAVALPGRPQFRRGDSNADGTTDIYDAVVTLNYLFLGEAPISCRDAADADDSGELDITDAVFLIGHLFLGGQAPPAPGTAACGADPTPDGLGICEYPAASCGP